MIFPISYMLPFYKYLQVLIANNPEKIEKQKPIKTFIPNENNCCSRNNFS